MKKIISLILVAVLLFSFAACNNDNSKDDKNTTENQSTIELNVEELKYNWTSGVLTFANGKQITLPCTVSQFLEASGLSINAYGFDTKVFAPDESKTYYAVDENTYISVKCINLTSEDIKVTEATVCEYSFNNTNKGNRNINFANTLTVGATKTKITEALGEPQNIAGENTLYYYKGKNDDMKKVELRIGFNSDDIVNSVAFKLEV